MPTSPGVQLSQDNGDEATGRERDSTDSPNDESERYVELDLGFTQYLTRSNDLQDLDLYGAFSKDEPNLSSNYHVKHLRSILKERDSERCLLIDAEGSYYVWDLWDGALFRVAEERTVDGDLDSVEDVVSNVLGNLYGSSQRPSRWFARRQMRRMDGGWEMEEME